MLVQNREERGLRPHGRKGHEGRQQRKAPRAGSPLAPTTALPGASRAPCLTGSLAMVVTFRHTFGLGMRTPSPPGMRITPLIERSAQAHRVQSGTVPPGGRSDGPSGDQHDMSGILDPVFLEMDLWCLVFCGCFVLFFF